MVRGEHVTSAAAVGDAEAKTVLDEFAWWIGLGLANLTHVLDPSTIVLGGGLVDAADLVLPGVRRHFAALVMAGTERRLPEMVARTSVVEGQRVSVRVDLAARRLLKTQTN